MWYLMKKSQRSHTSSHPRHLPIGKYCANLLSNMQQKSNKILPKTGYSQTSHKLRRQLYLFPRELYRSQINTFQENFTALYITSLRGSSGLISNPKYYRYYIQCLQKHRGDAYTNSLCRFGYTRVTP